MKKNIIIGLFVLFLLGNPKKEPHNLDVKRKMIFESIVLKYGRTKAKLLETVHAALLRAGLPNTALKLSLAQVLFETGVFSGKQRASKANNFSGITFSGSPAQLATGAKKSVIELPEARGVFYASYPTPLNWAKDYIRILSRGSKPIQSASPSDFSIRLKKNGYYTDTVFNYSRGITLYFNYLTKLGL